MLYCIEYLYKSNSSVGKKTGPIQCKEHKEGYIFHQDPIFNRKNVCTIYLEILDIFSY